jgi:opacity protein-like surface antigen
MQRWIFLCSVLCFSTIIFTPKAQAQVQLGINIGAGLPMDDDFSDFFETGFGGNFKFNYFIKDNVALGANLGYYSFDVEGPADWNLNIIPLTFHAEYYFSKDKIKPFLGGGLGLYFKSIGDDDGLFDDNDAYDDTDFGLNLGGGLLFNVSNKLDLGVDLRFHVIEDTSFAGLNFGLYFDL